MSEIWADVAGYNGKYQISTFGQFKQGEIIKEPVKVCQNKRYLAVGLVDNKKQTMHYIHRLVARHFLPNPYNYKSVNHNNGNRYDNRLCNLEWCSQKQNIQHAIKIGTFKCQLNKDPLKRNRKTVVNLWSGVFYDTIKDAAIASETEITTFRNKLHAGKSQYQIV